MAFYKDSKFAKTEFNKKSEPIFFFSNVHLLYTIGYKIAKDTSIAAVYPQHLKVEVAV